MAVQPVAPDMNQWGTVTFQIPDQLEAVRDKINTTAEFLVSVLDIALTALELVKTFLVGYLDPIGALVAAIIAEVESLVTDMRQLGIYITGDWKLLKWPYNDLQGGFQDYQRRMIGRLTDTTDPTRPDVSANTKVLAMFFYMSANTSDVDRLVVFVRKLMAFFRQSVTQEGSLPIPVPGTVQYGADAVSILNPSSIPEAFAKSPTPPALAKISWGMTSTSARSPFNPIPPLPPGGFIVSVSTVQDGLKVVFDAPQSNTSLQPSVTDATKTAQPREYGPVRIQDSGTPLVLFGGSDMVQVGFLDYNGYLENGVPKAGKSRVYGQLATGSDGVIPLEELYVTSSGQYLMQRVFYVPQDSKWASWATGGYGFVLAKDDMPYTCVWEKQSDGTIIPKAGSIELATTAYVRIAAVSPLAYEKQLQYVFGPPNGRAGRPYIDAILDNKLSSPDLGAWSRPVRVTFPGGNTQVYLEALKAALLVLVLSRPDLKLYDPSFQPLEVQKNVLAGKIVRDGEVKANCGLEKMVHLTDMVIENYQTSITKVGVKTPRDFRKMLLDSIERVAHNIYNTTGQNTQIEKIVAEQTKYLRTVTWGEILLANNLNLSKKSPAMAKSTLLQSLESQDTTLGLAMNPWCIAGDDVSALVVDRWMRIKGGVIRGRNPHMFEVFEGGVSPAIPGDVIVPADKVGDFLDQVAPSMVEFYTPFLQSDGSILVPEDRRALLDGLSVSIFIHGSADRSPVFYYDYDGLVKLQSGMKNYNYKEMGTMFYCRGLFANTNGGQIFQEAATALQIAAAAITRSSQDSAWIALRAFDIFPAMDDFFETLANWMKSLQKSIKSIVDTIKRYIEFIEAVWSSFKH
jgi:hypothetical protein